MASIIAGKARNASSISFRLLILPTLTHKIVDQHLRRPAGEKSHDPC
jgi:hypothetical protein